jgi:hypothetical protein
VRFQNINGFDVVFRGAFRVDGLNGSHCVDAHLTKELRITAHGEGRRDLLSDRESAQGRGARGRTYAPMILEDIEVRAAFIQTAGPSVSVLIVI